MRRSRFTLLLALALPVLTSPVPARSQHGHTTKIAMSNTDDNVLVFSRSPFARVDAEQKKQATAARLSRRASSADGNEEERRRIEERAREQAESSRRRELWARAREVGLSPPEWEELQRLEGGQLQPESGGRRRQRQQQRSAPQRDFQGMGERLRQLEKEARRFDECRLLLTGRSYADLTPEQHKACDHYATNLDATVEDIFHQLQLANEARNAQKQQPTTDGHDDQNNNSFAARFDKAGDRIKQTGTSLLKSVGGALRDAGRVGLPTTPANPITPPNPVPLKAP